MAQQLTLNEQIERARQVVLSWSVAKRSRMQLEGTDNFRERMTAHSTERIVEGREESQQSIRQADLLVD